MKPIRCPFSPTNDDGDCGGGREVYGFYRDGDRHSVDGKFVDGDHDGVDDFIDDGSVDQDDVEGNHFIGDGDHDYVNDG